MSPKLDESRFRNDIVLTIPHITEKSRLMGENGAYAFEVSRGATKNMVKRSVEDLYHVHVEHVRIINIPKKPRRRGLTSGSKGGYKKAIVSLRKSETIEMF
ncbi:MAG: 50S ribosomal protein L23 [Candidatus Ryanbacteria bacterium RIFCSPHIGHO2_02_FULL_45_43]|uniref:Large ribosomal subunit protein uL23 n=1 Tax=Candidatus Ryanbacteria bacterium RIFCSPHIGHO2_01_45_13 TaxID=1802112 RepID=A0A1G2FWN8_9BACT|nr:MAG: 50S ribosomal protein L23 [Candidatus Ryanbacteria bacterium RIFCSPHIGHO2_01_FULL_44_130]OGZ42495.1 MAG: 50S ribosomal protein L23 [Candidatus Ryanbacteria bacterium RIFCSPHIGHO2_01_45_13]OGZ48512.1 MAG: 50S ribosomal protein L23 [Candidatus Ryanbacteria bacterium RIFCSPHIGHO2_02_FULL_45_43]OGZ50374.1 MAG: 50S ribosomal protein L23 [Candidatus Ryanbacteria bacterium RIFCSPHIGHO2_12_FULL_44_20]OGZ51716.1 MAG: 50S ribosomal protein L23 [Candidatus Ryanbacteria bacterium RIFCSPLOWO2_01_FUL